MRKGISRQAPVTLLLLLITATASATVTRVIQNAATSPLDVGATNETQVIECLSALSYQLCDIDTTCRNRFYLDFFQSEAHRRSNFAYLLRVYLRLPVSGALPPIPESVPDVLVTPAWILAQLATVQPNDTDIGLPMLLAIDARFGSRCAETTLAADSGNVSLWFNTSTQVAELGRVWWLYALRLADFCTENEIFDEQLGCVCKEGKVCDEIDPGQYLFSIVSFIVLMVVATIIYMWQLFTTGAQVRALVADAAASTSAAETLLRVLEQQPPPPPPLNRSSNGTGVKPALKTGRPREATATSKSAKSPTPAQPVASTSSSISAATSAPPLPRPPVTESKFK
jgi:hypothetical protein